MALCNYLFGSCSVGIPDAIDEKAIFGIMVTPAKVAPILPHRVPVDPVDVLDRSIIIRPGQPAPPYGDPPVITPVFPVELL